MIYSNIKKHTWSSDFSWNHNVLFGWVQLELQLVSSSGEAIKQISEDYVNKQRNQKNTIHLTKN